MKGILIAVVMVWMIGDAYADGTKSDSAFAGDKSSAGASAQPVKWVAIPGGTFTLGTAEVPGKEVTITAFEMSKTVVTVEQYAECVKKNECTKPNPISDNGENCNFGVEGRQLYPINCVSWDQANQYAKFNNARLPSEAEWEYAAKSCGKDKNYPWGGMAKTCDLDSVYEGDAHGCTAHFVNVPVCSKAIGRTAQGLCDMAGNVDQWMKDETESSSSSASYRNLRGGSFNRAARSNQLVDGGHGSAGIRLVRSMR